MPTNMYKGRVVGVNSREYSFPDRQTGEKIEGVAHRMFLRVGDGSEQVLEMRVSDELVPVALDDDMKMVQVEAEPRARNNQVVWHAVALNGAQ